VPEVIDRVLLLDRVVQPNDSLSVDADVSGARHVNVSVGVSEAVEFQCTIYFGWVTVNGVFSRPLQTDTVGPSSVLWTSVPVYGPLLRVDIENQGSKPQVVDSLTIYAVREASSSISA
jgi:hypothetical protein